MVFDIVKGIAAALVSPITMTIGFIVWDECWKGSAFALNLFKCGLASSLFIIVSLIFQSSRDIQFHREDISMIMLSSFLGIIIGDNTWLLALQNLGAFRVIVVDCLKPPLAAALGYLVLKEPLTVSMVMGIIITMSGVYLVSTESSEKSHESPEETSTTLDSGDTETAMDEENSISLPRTVVKASHETKNQRSGLVEGYIFAFTNVALDAYGSVLTKQFGVSFNTWEINSIRFGFAAAVMGSISLSLFLLSKIYYMKLKSFPCLKLGHAGDEGRSMPTYSMHKEQHEEVVAYRQMQKASAVYAQVRSSDEEPPIEILHSVTTNHSSSTTATTIPVPVPVPIWAPAPIPSTSSEEEDTATNIPWLPVEEADDTAKKANNTAAYDLRTDITGNDSDINSKINDNSSSSSGGGGGNDCQERNNLSSEVLGDKNSSPWYLMPNTTLMTSSLWIRVSVGVIFVTFLCPTMSNYALFKLDLGLCLTLTSLGPVYAIPLLWIIKGDTVSLRAVLGTLLAVAGVAIMCLL